MQKKTINFLAQQATLWALGVITDYHFGLPVWAWYVIAAASIFVLIQTAPRKEKKMEDVDTITLVELERIRTENKKVFYEWLTEISDGFLVIILIFIFILPIILVILL